MNDVLAALGALVPPIGVGVVFWLVMRWIVQADRRERAAQAEFDAEVGARVGDSDGAVSNSSKPSADDQTQRARP